MKWAHLSALRVLGLNVPQLSAMLFTVLLLTGCISMPQSHLVTMAPNVTLQLTAPPEVLQMQAKTQLIEAQFNGETQSLLAQVEFTETQIKLVAMTPSGIPLFDVLWSVNDEAVINQYVPVPGLDISYVIADLQWVNWPLAQLQSATNGSFREEFSNHEGQISTDWTRILTQNGLVILTVEKFDNRYILKHLLRDYQITITELSKVSL
ncbi:DUF3261 domain-containing protein [Moritella viscosa]|uniref:Orphan protein n=1 Tax=Moritella viscosa TaxID=80854 RepID=A0A090IHP4_9GAMM|nr:DUF3261 domain-containing protein [Moritella viscosa]CED59484.1 putative lipoprotein [Moritella viscosa]SGY86616.1 Putative orphan protein [Moritella viscosa]SGY87968.1 Putative orphan protein [Moritella viscosa]SGY89908.1 Putative orphan protein [Moritella viscosa]SGY90456.1 Putative orphan protein [Moritella viscosa]